MDFEILACVRNLEENYTQHDIRVLARYLGVLPIPSTIAKRLFSRRGRMGGAECNICFDSEKNELVVPLQPCGHEFHRSCVQDFCNAAAESRQRDGFSPLERCTCPICRRPIDDMVPVVRNDVNAELNEGYYSQTINRSPFHEFLINILSRRGGEINAEGHVEIHDPPNMNRHGREYKNSIKVVKKDRKIRNFIDHVRVGELTNSEKEKVREFINAPFQDVSNTEILCELYTLVGVVMEGRSGDIRIPIIQRIFTTLKSLYEQGPDAPVIRTVSDFDNNDLGVEYLLKNYIKSNPFMLVLFDKFRIQNYNDKQRRIVEQFFNSDTVNYPKFHSAMQLLEYYETNTKNPLHTVYTRLFKNVPNEEILSGIPRDAALLTKLKELVKNTQVALLLRELQENDPNDEQREMLNEYYNMDFDNYDDVDNSTLELVAELGGDRLTIKYQIYTIFRILADQFEIEAPRPITNTNDLTNDAAILDILAPKADSFVRLVNKIRRDDLTDDEFQVIQEFIELPAQTKEEFYTTFDALIQNLHV